MTTQEIASRLVELSRQGQFDTAHQELYAEDAVSIEPEAGGGFAKETRGLEAIKAKGEQWNAMVKEVHGMEVSEPVVADNAFACTMLMDITMQDGNRWKMKELCVYRLKDGKVVSEQFYM